MHSIFETLSDVATQVSDSLITKPQREYTSGPTKEDEQIQLIEGIKMKREEITLKIQMKLKRHLEIFGMI